MKKYTKVYLTSLLISMVFCILPWLLGEIGVVNSRHTLFPYAPIGAVIAILLSSIYVVKKTNSWKPRVVLFFLNPALYYFILLLVILYLFYLESLSGSSGWYRLVP